MPPKTGSGRILNCIGSRDRERDWLMEQAATAGVLREGVVPTARDLREPWWEINDQGRTGSCVGWACADGVVRWHMVKSGRLPQDQLLSPRFVWMASKETDEFTSYPTTFIEEVGTSLKAALDVARIFGNVPDSILPFEGGLYPGKEEVFFAIASRYRIAGYFNLGADLAKWRQWIGLHGPILTRLVVDATWWNAKQTGGRLETYMRDTAAGGHAVALVGYTKDHFIVRNSWGTTEWGDKGFGYATDAYATVAFNEAYGVAA